jgi:hypothetical protein
MRKPKKISLQDNKKKPPTTAHPQLSKFSQKDSMFVVRVMTIKGWLKKQNE